MDYPAGYTKHPLWQWLVIYLIIGGLIYAAIYYFYFAKKGVSLYQATTQSATQTINQNTVDLTASGFQPNSLTIKAGQTVSWTNQTNNTGNVSSAPHPAHTDYPPLNLGDIAPGANASLTFPTPGTYRYHNHLNPAQFGSITVQ